MNAIIGCIGAYPISVWIVTSVTQVSASVANQVRPEAGLAGWMTGVSLAV